MALSLKRVLQTFNPLVAQKAYNFGHIEIAMCLSVNGRNMAQEALLITPIVWSPTRRILTRMLWERILWERIFL